MVERKIKSGVIKLLKQLTKNLSKKKVKVEKIILFGSRARGEELLASDIDILIISDNFAKIPFVERLEVVERAWPSNQLLLEAIPLTLREFEARKKQIGVVQKAAREGLQVAV